MCHRYGMISFTTTQRNFESPRSPIQNRRSSRKLDTSLDYSRGSRMEFRDCQAWKSGLRKSAILIYLIIICSPFSLHCSHFPKSPQRDHTVFLFLPECFYRRISIFKEFLERSCVSFLFSSSSSSSSPSLGREITRSCFSRFCMDAATLVANR